MLTRIVMTNGRYYFVMLIGTIDPVAPDGFIAEEIKSI